MTSLVTVAEYNTATGSDYTESDERMLALLEMASALVRAECRQRFDLVVGDIVSLRTDDHVIHLPERPVLAVNALSISAYGSSIPYIIDVGSLIWTPSGVVVNGRWPWGSWATVDYDHGYDPVPADVKSLVTSIAARSLTNPAGVQSESIMSYSVSYGSGAGGVGGVFPEHERKLVRNRYRPVAYASRVKAAHEP